MGKSKVGKDDKPPHKTQERKDARAFVRGVERVDPSSGVLGGTGLRFIFNESSSEVIYTGEKWGEEELLDKFKGEEELLDKFKASIEPRIAELDGKRIEIANHYNAAFEDPSQWSVVEKKSTDWLSDMKKSGFLPASLKRRQANNFELVAYRFRAFARYMTNNSEGAVLDATEAIGMLRDGHYASKPMMEKIISLLVRGMCLAKQDKLEDAIVDFKAAVAGLYSTDKTWDGFPSTEFASIELLKTMTLQKLKENSPRPYYTDKEKEKISKQLRWGVYSNDRHKCLECGAAPSSTVQLKICSGCRGGWFCNAECQKKSWKKGHKKECGPERVCHLVLDQAKAAVRKRIDENKLFPTNARPLGGNNIEPCMIVRDPETGRLFDSLRDDDIFFLPSDEEYMQEYMQQQQANQGKKVQFTCLIRDDITFYLE
jgi:hypothetical protein